MRVLIVSVVAPPDQVSTAQLVGEIAEDLADLGHDVRVLTTMPHYNLDSRDGAGAQISGPSRAQLFGESRQGEVAFEHVRMSAKASSHIGRVLQWSWFYSAVRYRTRSIDSDAVLIVSPPPVTALAVPRHQRIVVAVWELYPEILVAMGAVKRGSLLVKALEHLESRIYRRAAHVSFLSESMRSNALERYPWLESESSVVPTFADTRDLRPQEGPSALRAKLGLDPGAFVVGYGGNIGPAQDLAALIRAATELDGRSVNGRPLHFLICGEGTEKHRLKALASSAQNVSFVDQLPYSAVSDMYAAFDVSVVALASGIGGEALPSKLYRSFACGVPILAIAEAGSSLAELVEQSGTGIAVAPGQLEALCDAVLTLASDGDLGKMASAARSQAVSNFDRSVVVRRLEELLCG